MENFTVRNIVFTLNNYTPDDIEHLQGVVDNFEYIIWGKEVGESETPHLQGMGQLKKITKFNTVKHMISDRAHIEKMRGTPTQARDYCAKDGDYEEHGTLRSQGQRSDIKAAIAALEGVSSMREAATIVPEIVLKYPRGVQLLIESAQPKRNFKPSVTWLWGATGTGKTRKAVDCESYYIKDNTKWWDGYGHETRIIIDDFDGAEWNFRTLLRLLDRYEFQGETKGGYIAINSKEIYITCEFIPDHYWRGNMLAQVLRRVDEVKECVTDEN